MKYKDSRLLYRCITKHTHTNPPRVAGARALQLPDIALASIIACGASCAFMLPIATPPNAIVYATGKIRLGGMARVGLLLNIACILIIGLLAHGLWVHW